MLVETLQYLCHGAYWNATTLEVNSFIKAKIFIPHFHDCLTWPPAGNCLLLPVALLKPHPVLSPHGCGFALKCHSAGIRVVRLNSSHKVEEKVFLLSYHSGFARMEWAVFQLSNPQTSVVAQAPLGCQKSLVLDTSKNWLLDLPLLLPKLCPFCSLAGVGGFVLSSSTEIFPSWSHSAAFLEGRHPPFPPPRVQQQRSSLFASISNFEWN